MIFIGKNNFFLTLKLFYNKNISKRVYLYLRNSSMSSNLINMYKNSLGPNTFETSHQLNNVNKLFKVIVEFYEKNASN